MIKSLSIDYLGMDSDEEYNRISSIVNDKKNNDMIKVSKSNNIFYKGTNEEKVKQILNINISEAKELPLYISFFNGGEYIRIGCEEITIAKCIEELQDKLDQYENRIWNSLDIDKEISKILKEQVKVVFKKQMESEQEKIDNIINGNINWE